MADRQIDILIVSDSKLLVDGLRKILESEDHISVAADLSSLEELKAFIEDNKPDYILLDQRTLNPEIERFLCSRAVRPKVSEIILLSGEDENEQCPGSFMKISHDTSAIELVELMSNVDEYREKLKSTKKLAEDRSHYLTKTESRIINLITSGHSNKEIARKLRVSEKTIKAHITNIFAKLDMQNRYQLMVYGRRNTGRM